MITKIKLEKWKSHNDTEIEFEKGTNVIVGVMGSGKSSIMDGLCYGLFGTYPGLQTRRTTMDETIMNKPYPAEEAKIEIEIKQKNDEYKIIRKIKRKGSNEAELYKNGKFIAGPKISEVTKILEQEIDINYELFSRAVYSEQNQIDYFLKLSPKDRKEKFDDLLNLKKYENVRNEATKTINRIKNRMGDQEKILEQQKTNIKEEDEEKLEKEIKEKQERINKIKEEEENLEKKINQVKEEFEKEKEKKEKYEKSKYELTKMKTIIETTQKEIKEKEEKIQNKQIEKIIEEETEIEKQEKETDKKIKEKETEIEETEKKIKEQREKIDKIKEKENTKKQEIKIIENQIQQIQKECQEVTQIEGNCPTCKQEMSQEHITKYLERAKEKIEEKQKQITKIEEDTKQIEKEIEKEKQEITKIEEEKILKRKTIEEIRKDKEKINEEKYKIRKTIEEIKQIKEKQEKLNEIIEKPKQIEQEIKQINYDEKKYEDKYKEWIETKNKQENIEKEIKNIKEIITQMEKTREQIKKQKEIIKQIEQEIKQKKEIIPKISMFINALKDTQMELRQNLIETINIAMTELWEKIYPYGDYINSKMEIDTDGNYELKVQQRNGSWNKVEGILSGGERTAAAICIRIAFSLVLTKNLNMLILDEPTHNLDTQTVKSLNKMLKENLPDLVEQIFIITHDKEMENAATAKLYELKRNKDEDEPTKIEIRQVE